MKHDIIRADANSHKMVFLFECKYFDRKGDVRKIKKFSSDVRSLKGNTQKIFLSNDVSSKTAV